MKISVVVACRNEGRTLCACLDALALQDHPDFEIIVVDGGSTDGSMDIVSAHELMLLHDPGDGPATARNVGIAAATGEIIAFTDGDCVPRFDWLTRLATHFDDPTVAGVSGGLRLPRGTLLGRLEDNDARVHYRGYITGNVAYRRDVLREVGGFDGGLLCAEDYDIAWRILDRGHRIVHAPEAVVLHAPPELGDGFSTYLRKQFWYARHDVPTHVQALARASRSDTNARGSHAAAWGLVEALGNSTLVAGVGLAIALRSGRLLSGALAAAAMVAARRTAATVRAVGEGDDERARMTAVEIAKRAARGLGTLVGLAELARPSSWSLFTGGAKGAALQGHPRALRPVQS